jgi:8-oxo-dGTP diphosphatase
MVKTRYRGMEHWCLPGGRVEDGETPEEAAVRELWEECQVDGTIVRQICFIDDFSPGNQAYTFLVDIGDQHPQVHGGSLYQETTQTPVDARWLRLSEIPERDRAYLLASGLLNIDSFRLEVTSWGDDTSYPRPGSL